jgi:hypothetical protein
MLTHALAVLTNGVAAIAVRVALLALTVSAVAVIAGWIRRAELLERQCRPPSEARAAPRQSAFGADVLDIAVEATKLMLQLESVAAQTCVALEVAVEQGLAVRANSRVLREILTDLVTDAIGQTPCGRVLLAAAHVGGRLQITVSDDGMKADRALRAIRLRSAQQLAALQGATMDIQARPGEGTTVVLRLPAAKADRQPTEPVRASDPASVWETARPTQENGAGRPLVS